MAKRNLAPYIRKGLFVVGVLALMTMLVLLKRNHQKQLCGEVSIEIVVPSDKQMLTEAMVQAHLGDWYQGGLVGLPARQIDLHDIETRLSELPAVADVEVSFHMNGKLQIQINQRIPIVRIYQDVDRSYYLDMHSGIIPSASHEPARVPVASGALSEEMITKIYTLATYVQENQFAEALVEQIFVTDDGTLLLVPKVGSHQIILGEPTELETKFHKLEIFYKKGLNQVGWDKYNSVDLRYANQIVCK